MADDFLSTTAVVTYVRRRVTPTMLWSAVAALVTTLVVTITWIVNMQSDVRQFKETDGRREKTVADMQAKLEVINQIATRLAVIDSKLDTMAAEQNRERERWDRIDRVAEEAPHAQRRHH